MLTPRDVTVIEILARYYVLTREQIQRRCFPDDPHGRVTRRRLQALVADGFVDELTKLASI